MARPRQVSDEQILTTLRRCVMEQGAQVSLDVVAEELGVTPPALLKRFGNRQEMMLQALRPPENPAWVQALDAAPDSRPFVDQLEEHCVKIAQFFEEVLPCMMALRESGIPHDQIFSAKVRANPLQGIQKLGEWLGQAANFGLISAKEHTTAATALFGALQTRAFMAHMMKLPATAESHRAYARELATLFTRALQGTERPFRKGTT